jgi:alpha-1,2-mannosyltransferase
MRGDGLRGDVGRAIVAVGLICYGAAVSMQSGGFDFATFYAAGAAIRHPERQLYRVSALADNPFGPVFKLPPSAALYLAPLTLSRPGRAEQIWQGVLSLAYWASFALIARTMGVRLLSWTWLLGVAAWALFSPAHESIGAGQWDTLFLLMLALGLSLVRAHSPLAALPIALAASVKPYPMLAVLYFVGRREWRSLGMSVVALAVLLALGAVVAGFGETWTYLSRVLPASGVTTAYPDNQSLGGLIARLATDDLRPVPLLHAPLVDGAIRAVALALSAVVALSLRQPLREDDESRAMQFAVTVPVLVLVIPVAWTHYFTVLLLPIYLLLIDQVRRRRASDAGWYLLAAAYGLLLLPGPVTLIGGEIDPGYWSAAGIPENLPMAAHFPTAAQRLLLSYQTLGALTILGLAAVRAGVRAPKAATTQAAVPAPDFATRAEAV